MKATEKNIVINVLTAVILAAMSFTGLLSFNSGHPFYVTNQYGDVIKMWGYGIYARDSFFRGPIFAGTDAVALFVLLPVYIVTYLNYKKNDSFKNLTSHFAIVSVILYYSASVAFGVTYNKLHLLYIALFSLCFFNALNLLIKIYSISLKEESKDRIHLTGGLKIFLTVSGMSLFIAWLPDIISSLLNNSALSLIEVYTTEVTYILDMGILSPLIFITMSLIKKNNMLGTVLLKMLLRMFISVGITLPVQTLFQYLSGVDLPIPVLITKVMIFLILSLFAMYFDRKFSADKKTAV